TVGAARAYRRWMVIVWRPLVVGLLVVAFAWVAGCSDDPPEVRRPDVAGRLEFDPGFDFAARKQEDTVAGPMTLVVGGSPVAVPADTPFVGGCQGMYTPDVPCVGQVGLAEDG